MQRTERWLGVRNCRRGLVLHRSSDAAPASRGASTAGWLSTCHVHPGKTWEVAEPRRGRATAHRHEGRRCPDARLLPEAPPRSTFSTVDHAFWLSVCQWQPKTAHFWQLKTAHFRGATPKVDRKVGTQPPALDTDRATFVYVQTEDATASGVRSGGGQPAALWAALAGGGRAVEVAVVGPRSGPPARGGTGGFGSRRWHVDDGRSSGVLGSGQKTPRPIPQRPQTIARFRGREDLGAIVNQRFAVLADTLDAKCETLLAMSPIAAGRRTDRHTGRRRLPVLRGRRAPLCGPHEAPHPRPHTESIRSEFECGFVSLAHCP